MSTIASHIHAALSALAQNESLCAMAQDAFGAPLLFCSGSSFGQERELGFAHAPFIALLHGENEAALEIFSASLPIPRTFYLRLITGTPICTNFPGLTSPLPPIPTATQRSTPTIYAAGQGETGERLHLHAIKILTELLRSRALTSPPPPAPIPAPPASP